MSVAMDEMVDQRTYEAYLDAVLKGDRTECARLVQNLVAAGVDLKSLYLDVFQRALHEVGELWEKQKISVAVEHLATATTERMLTLVQPHIFASGGPRRESILVACSAGEFHQIGARMVADLCELSGWRGYFLGTDTSLDDLLRTVAERRPTILALSLSLLTNLPSLKRTIAAVTVAHPHLPIVVGGQAFRGVGQAALQGYGDVRYLASFAELELRLNNFDR